MALSLEKGPMKSAMASTTTVTAPLTNSTAPQTRRVPPGKVNDAFVYVPSRNVTVFAYEASRPDADDTSNGVESAGPGLLQPCPPPWTNVTAAEAAEACDRLNLKNLTDPDERWGYCADGGRCWQLCEEEAWEDICQGDGNNLCPDTAPENPASSRCFPLPRNLPPQFLQRRGLPAGGGANGPAFRCSPGVCFQYRGQHQHPGRF